MVTEYGTLTPGSVRIILAPYEPVSKLSTLRSAKDGEGVAEGAAVEVSVGTSVFVGGKGAKGVDVSAGGGSVAGAAVGVGVGAGAVTHEESTKPTSTSVAADWILCTSSP